MTSAFPSQLCSVHGECLGSCETSCSRRELLTWSLSLHPKSEALARLQYRDTERVQGGHCHVSEEPRGEESKVKAFRKFIHELHSGKSEKAGKFQFTKTSVLRGKRRQRWCCLRYRLGGRAWGSAGCGDPSSCVVHGLHLLRRGLLQKRSEHFWQTLCDVGRQTSLHRVGAGRSTELSAGENGIPAVLSTSALPASGTKATTLHCIHS